MSRRPFLLIPRITHSPQLRWTYLRWGRRLRRIGMPDRLPPCRAVPILLILSLSGWVAAAGLARLVLP